MNTGKGSNAQISSDARLSIIGYASEITNAYVSSNQVSAAELSSIIHSVHDVILGLYLGSSPAGGNASAAHSAPVRRATSEQIAASISRDYLISFENGIGYKSLKQHLKNSGLSFEKYKEKWGLPADYPSCSANYSERRSQIARATGLGGQRGLARRNLAVG